MSGTLYPLPAALRALLPGDAGSGIVNRKRKLRLCFPELAKEFGTLSKGRKSKFQMVCLRIARRRFLRSPDLKTPWVRWVRVVTQRSSTIPYRRERREARGSLLRGETGAEPVVLLTGRENANSGQEGLFRTARPTFRTGAPARPEGVKRIPKIASRVCRTKPGAAMSVQLRYRRLTEDSAVLTVTRHSPSREKTRFGIFGDARTVVSDPHGTS